MVKGEIREVKEEVSMIAIFFCITGIMQKQQSA